MINIPFIKIDIQEEIVQVYINKQPIHQERVEALGLLKHNSLFLIEIYQKDNLIWKAYRLKNKDFIEIYGEIMKKRYHI